MSEIFQALIKQPRFRETGQAYLTDTTLSPCKLGANAILAVSLAVAKAGAGVKKVPLYQVCSSILIHMFVCT